MMRKHSTLMVQLVREAKKFGVRSSLEIIIGTSSGQLKSVERLSVKSLLMVIIVRLLRPLKHAITEDFNPFTVKEVEGLLTAGGEIKR
ncbi:hypothetical protein [Enterococcus sp.]|uniref:hypothetical protein n=1 Tax=Enterococcus sp. TaxID=35783 RepID=UPI0029103162|nr:hypothetical protein [Enterococcus sp.]MDU5334052.1 hypothetical protein [Enterococcus sp.]